jgi:hypothetical protein
VGRNKVEGEKVRREDGEGEEEGGEHQGGTLTCQMCSRYKKPWKTSPKLENVENVSNTIQPNSEK